MNFHFDLRWCYGQTETQEFEPQLFALLKAVAESGSIRAAADQCQVSYRHAWGLMQKWETILGDPLVLMERGRGAKLTRLGEKLLWGQRSINARLTAELDSLASDLNTELRRLIKSETQPVLKIFASHGLAVSLLRELTDAGETCKLDLQFRGSLECLQLLNSNKCDMAAFHFPEGELASVLAPRYRPWLNPEHMVLIQVIHRQQGLMTAPGNPKGISTIRELTKPGIRFINRQPNSGTRLLFDKILERHHIQPEQILGYQTEEFTHIAVAALIASGAADVSFGIQAAAGQFGLHFIPFVQERYLFALRQKKLHDPAVEELIRILKGSEYYRRTKMLAGYDARGAGDIIKVEQILPML